MCTLITLHRVHRDYPLVVAANRDELFARGTGPAAVRDGALVAGVDLEKGGTWLGVSARGFFVGLTNQRSSGPPDPALRSRGEVVTRALAQPTLDAAVAWLGTLDARTYNAFNLLLGDAAALWVAYARGDAPRVEVSALSPGVYALPNDRLGSTEFPKIDRATLLAAPLANLPWDELVPRAQAMLADHVLPAPERIAPTPEWLPPELRAQLQALCVHTPVYGTRSSCLFALDASGLVHYLDAAGRPCETPLLPRPDLVSALGHG